MAINSIVAIVVALIAGICLGGLMNEFRHMLKQIEQMGKRIEQLEQSQVKHLPYKTADAIEDACAAILRLKFENDLRGDFIDNALAHLGKARNGNGKEK